MAAFDPHTQEVRFLLADGKTPIAVPIPEIDALNHISLSVCITYGAQLGACFIMLVVLVIMTPSNKFKTVSTILHILALVMCIIRMSLLIAYFPSGFNEFYNYWAVDYTSVSPGDYRTSIMGNVASLLVVIVIEAALVAQAQAMVHMWHNAVKHTLFIVSILLTLLTVSWRLAFTIFQCQATLDLESAHPFRWVARWSVITNAVSICWYCAIFNIKLTTHVFCNRGILLRSCKSLTAMDALVMTNGILMIVPGSFHRLGLHCAFPL